MPKKVLKERPQQSSFAKAGARRLSGNTTTRRAKPKSWYQTQSAVNDLAKFMARTGKATPGPGAYEKRSTLVIRNKDLVLGPKAPVVRHRAKNTPAPGAYNKRSTFHKAARPGNLYGIGKAKIIRVPKNSVPGSGSYNMQSTFKRAAQPGDLAFISKAPINRHPTKKTPGPGSYKRPDQNTLGRGPRHTFNPRRFNPDYYLPH